MYPIPHQMGCFGGFLGILDRSGQLPRSSEIIYLKNIFLALALPPFRHDICDISSPTVPNDRTFQPSNHGSLNGGPITRLARPYGYPGQPSTSRWPSRRRSQPSLGYSSGPSSFCSSPSVLCTMSLHTLPNAGRPMIALSEPFRFTSLA